MAYTELRGDYYRGRYKNPDGVAPKWGTVSEDPSGTPFHRRADAQRAADDREAELRALAKQWAGPTPAGISLADWKDALHRQQTGRDTRAGDITLADWVTRVWWPAQDLEDRTVDQYTYRLKTMILPTFGDRPVRTLNEPAEIIAWEVRLRQRYARSTAADSRSLLATILGDAEQAGLVDFYGANPAARQRGRGRKSARSGGGKAAARVWASPLELLLIAERCALLTGRDSDFVMWVTAAWCGLRWGELLGIEAANVGRAELRVEWQLSELGGAFTRKRPKDESIRNGDRDFYGAVDLPPFLARMLADHQRDTPPRGCLCPGRRCGSGGRNLFLGSDGGHPHRSDYNRRYWHPAVDGVYPGTSGKRVRPARPVLADAGAGWPGLPLRPPWPRVEGPEWEPPRGKGWTRWDGRVVDAVAVACGACGAAPLLPCVSGSGRVTAVHGVRTAAAVGAGLVRDRALVSWLGVKPGLVPHGLRHTHKTWMIEDRIPEILQHDRLGHAMGGIGATYSHVSAAMRGELVGALELRWERALAARAALAAGSPVRVLDRWLAGVDHPGSGDRLPNVSQS